MFENQEITADLRSLKIAGATALELLHMMQQRGLKSSDMMFNFMAAFGLSLPDVQTIGLWQSNIPSTERDFVTNQTLEDAIPFGDFAGQNLIPPKMRGLLEEHMAWLTSAGENGKQFHLHPDVEISRMNFTGWDLSRSDWSGVRIDNCMFQDCAMNAAVFTKATLNNVFVKNCTLNDACLTGMSVDSVYFEQSYFHAVDFANSSFLNSTFERSSCEWSVFRSCSMKYLSFSESNLSHSVFDNSELSECHFVKLDMSFVSLCFTHLTNVSLQDITGIDKIVATDMMIDDGLGRVKYQGELARKWLLSSDRL